MLGDEPVAERAPIVDLWLRAARRNGAEILYELDEDKVRAAERAILIWSGPDGETRARGARGTARRLGRFLPAAHAERARRLRGVGRGLGRGRARGARPRSTCWSSRATRRCESRRARARRAGGARARVRHVRAPGARPRRPAAPGDELPRARGNVRQPRGTPAAASPRRHAAGARRARLDREARRALRRRHPAVRGVRVRGAVGTDLRRAPFAAIGEQAPLPSRAPRDAEPARPKKQSSKGLRALRSSRTGRSSPAPPSSASRSSSSSARRPSSSSRRRTHARAGSRTAPRSRRARTERRSASARASRASSRREPCAPRRSTSAASCTTSR